MSLGTISRDRGCISIEFLSDVFGVSLAGNPVYDLQLFNQGLCSVPGYSCFPFLGLNIVGRNQAGRQ